MKNKYVRIALILVAAFLVWRIYELVIPAGASGDKKGSRPPVAIEFAEINTGMIQETRQLTGTVFPLYQYVVAPKVSGRLVEMRKRIGDAVRQGEVVAVIDDAEYQQALREAEANLKIAEASLLEARSQFDLSRQERERMEQLRENNMVSSAEFETADTKFKAQQSRLQLAKAQVEQRAAALKSSAIRLNYTVLTASQPGFVGERFVDEGTLLAPNNAVLSVVGIDKVFIRTTVIERDYGRMLPGQAATVTVDAFAGKQFPGTVSRIAPKLDQSSRVAEMEVEVANDSLLLKPGMFARVNIVLQQKDNARLVPAKSLVTHNGTTGIYIVDEGAATAKYVAVQTGIVSETLAEITAPEITGKVITLGQHLLEDGSPVLLPTESTPNN
jgi:RND family efflux transporter MFP subunit